MRNLIRQLFWDPEKFEEVERKGRYMRFFNSPEGEWILKDLAAMYHVVSAVTTNDMAGRVDPLRSAYDDGQRSVPLFILNYVNSPLIEPPELDEEEF